MSQQIKLVCHIEAATAPDIIFPMCLGMHIYSSENLLIESGKRAFVETGVSIEVPTGFYAQVVGRFSLTTIGIYVSTVTFDHSYHGTIRVMIQNDGRHEYPIAIGDKIAEVLIMPLDNPVCVHRNLFEDLGNPESMMMPAVLPDLSTDPEALQM